MRMRSIADRYIYVGTVKHETDWQSQIVHPALEPDLNPHGNVWLAAPGYVLFQLPWGGQQAVHDHNYSALCAERDKQQLRTEKPDYTQLWSLLDADAAF